MAYQLVMNAEYSLEHCYKSNLSFLYIMVFTVCLYGLYKNTDDDLAMIRV